MCGYFHGDLKELELRETANSVSWSHSPHVQRSAVAHEAATSAQSSGRAALHPRVPPLSLRAGATRASLKGQSPSDTARKSWTSGGSSLPAGCAPARWGSPGFRGAATRTDGKNAATALPCTDAGTAGGAGFPSLPPFLLCVWPIRCARVETDNLTPPCFV